MGKKILIAVGDCDYSKHAVKYAATISRAVKDLTYTLFNVQASVPNIFTEEAQKNPEVQAGVDALVREGSEASICVVGKLKDLLLEYGVTGNHIEVITEPMQDGPAKDILERAKKGSYQAIVLASKGLTPRKDFFVGTTAAKVLDHALQMSVWVVDEYTKSLDVMVAVDGSKGSFRALDHVIAMVGANPDLRLVLFHVLPYLSHYYNKDFERKNPHLQKLIQEKDNQRMETFYSKALKKLEEAGIKRSQVEIKTDTYGYDISTAILGESRSGRYGTLVVGRRGEREAFYTGRIAMRLAQKMPTPVLWVVA